MVDGRESALLISLSTLRLESRRVPVRRSRLRFLHRLPRPLLPYRRITGAMEYGQHYDVLIPLTEVNTVGKSLRDGFMRVAVQNGKLIGVAGNALDQAFDFGEELQSKSGALLLIPITSFVKLAPRLPTENDTGH